MTAPDGLFQVRPAGLSDANVVAATLCTALGDGYVTEVDVRALIAAGVVLMAVNMSGEACGAVTGGALADFPDALHDTNLPVGATARVGVVKALVVTPEHRGHGLAGALLAAASDALRARGHDVLAALAWRSGSTQSSEPVFARAGWTVAGVIDGAWAQESLTASWVCPVCGVPCVCAAVVFVHHS